MMTMKPFRYLAAIGLLTPLMAAPAFQAVTVKRVPTEQATIKVPLNAGERMEQFRMQGGPGSKTPDQIHYKEVTLQMLLKRAYKIKQYQISGPAWIDTERYNVDAQLPAGTNAEQLQSMLQTLLTERFRLQAHFGPQLMMTYHLIVAEGGAKLLPPEKPASPPLDSKQQMEELRRSMQERMAANKGERGRSFSNRSFGSTSGKMSTLAETLSSYVNAPVKDDTKIEGPHAYRVEWVPEDPNAMPGPNLFMALEEQLGLKLRGEKAEVQVLVIDKVEMEPVGK